MCRITKPYGQIALAETERYLRFAVHAHRKDQNASSDVFAIGALSLQGARARRRETQPPPDLFRDLTAHRARRHRDPSSRVRVPHTGPAPPVGPDASGAEGRFPTPASKMPGARGKKTQGTHDWIGTLLDENTGDAAPKKKRGRPASRKPTASDGSDSRYPPASSPLFQSLSSSPKFPVVAIDTPSPPRSDRPRRHHTQIHR